jgi:hypothetical protein
MYHITDVQLLAGVFAVLLWLALLAAKAVLDSRKEKSAPFRNYFGSGYERELLRHSDLSESEDWRADRESRSTPFRLRETSLDEQRIRVSATLRSHREKS